MYFPDIDNGHFVSGCTYSIRTNVKNLNLQKTNRKLLLISTHISSSLPNKPKEIYHWEMQ